MLSGTYRRPDGVRIRISCVGIEFYSIGVVAENPTKPGKHRLVDPTMTTAQVRRLIADTKLVKE